MSVVGYNQNQNLGNVETSPLSENSSEEEWVRGSIKQPKYISIPLFPHQLKSVADMERFERQEEIDLPREVSVRVPNCNWDYRAPQGRTFRRWDLYSNRKFRRFFGIQADMVGYGKTLSMVSLISRDNMEWDMSTPYVVHSKFKTDMYSLSYKNIIKKVNVTIVLASLSCIRQWEADFDKASNIKLLVVNTNKIIQEKCQEIANKTDFPYNVILLTPTMFKFFFMCNRNVIWKRFVFDEPAQLRVPAMPYVMAGFTWFVTATPATVVKNQGRGNWVGQIFDWNKQGYSRIFIVKNPTEFVKKSFDMPETEYRDYICWQPIAARLDGIVPNHVNQMIQAGDIYGAISAIGGTNCTKGGLIEIIRQRKKMDLEYVDFMLRRCTTHRTGRRNESAIKDWSDRRDKLLQQLEKLEETAKELMESQCPICLENMSEPMIMEPTCQKVFCAECFLTWHMTNSTCPLCRSRVEASQLLYVSEEEARRQSSRNKMESKPLSKLQRIKRIFKERDEQNPHSKFIIATQFGSTVWYEKIQKTILDEMNILWCEISGRMTTRNKNVKAFQSGSTRVIFISNLDSTAGVNLQAATDVIIFNEMSESQREQVIGRANRIGRKQPLIVHTLYADNGAGERFRAT